MDFNSYIQHPELLDRESLYELRSYVALYPCHQAARLLMLKNLFMLHDPTFDEELRNAAFYIADRSVLFGIVEAKYYTLPATENTATQAAADHSQTEAIIATFLNSVPKEDSGKKPTVAEATVDYMSYMMARDDEEKNNSNAPAASSDLIDNFLENGGGRITIPPTPQTEADAPHNNVTIENDKDELQESFYTENLAKIYVRQGNYSKALEIIKQLNLNNSGKNAYFADQMRFLEKVIAATRHSQAH